MIRYIFITILTFFTLSCDFDTSVKLEVSNNDDSYQSIPGPRNCFWSRGPISKDPYINIAYPDANVFYWSAAFTIPEGARLYLKGEFPYSRYMSLISYDGKGTPIESLADYLIIPDENSINPFVEGSARNHKNRSYTIEILNLPQEIRREEGVKLDLQTDIRNGDSQNEILKRNSLNATQYGQGQQSIVYRIYVPDKGKD